MSGDCECGCGLPAPIAKSTNSDRGIVKGQRLRFVLGHGNRGRTKAKKQAEQAQADKLLETVPEVCLRVEGEALQMLLRPVVYVFYLKNRCIYVGSGASGSRPFAVKHHRRQHLISADRAMIYPCKSRQPAAAFEKALIKELKPFINCGPRANGPRITPAFLLERVREFQLSKVEKAS